MAPEITPKQRRRNIEFTASAFVEEVEAFLTEHPDRYIGPLRVLAEAEAFRQVAQDRLTHIVATSRRNGATWEAIGQSLGVTKQAAQQRYGPYCAR